MTPHDHARWSPHRWCYLDDGAVTLRFLVGEGLTLLAYLSLPVTLLVLARRRPDLVPPWFAWMFGCFILSCGIGHGWFLFTLYEPWYGVESTWSVLTGILSIGSAVALPALLPRILAVPRAADLAAAERRLEEAMARAELATQRAEELGRQLDIARGVAS